MRWALTFLALVVAGCTCESSHPSGAPVEAGAAPPSATPTPAPSSAPSAEAEEPPAPYPKRTTSAWPLDMEACSATPCKLPDGTPGLRCTPGQACFNPCPPGLGPEGERWSCAKLCKTNADCGKDPCVKGVCDRWPKHPCKDPKDNCTTAEGEMGFRCGPSDKCLSMCKRGLVVYGGTHCAKPCKADAECPGGSCAEGVCVPLCPSEGCPYRWE